MFSKRSFPVSFNPFIEFRMVLILSVEILLEKFSSFLTINPRDKHGLHHYKIDDFGLTEELVNEKFESYIEFLNKLN